MKKSFILYHDQENTFNQLTNEEAGVLIKAIFKSNHSEVKLKDRMLQILLTNVLQQIDRDAIKYAEKCKKLRENGSKGGKARADNVKQLQANVSLNDNDNNNPNAKEVSVWAQQYALENSLNSTEVINLASKAHQYYNKCMHDLNKRTWHDNRGNKVLNWKLKIARVWLKDCKPVELIKVKGVNVC